MLQLLYKSYVVDRYASYITLREALDMKNMLYSVSRLLFIVNGHTDKRKQ